jgi:carboxynorspermidine decarboxylase
MENLLPSDPGTLTPATLPTPAFVVDAAALQRNLAVLAHIKARTGCKILLAQKAFSMFRVYPLLSRTLDGTCASSVHEARLGRDFFDGEVHAFAAAFSDTEMRSLAGIIDHITLNSFRQWRQFQPLVAGAPRRISCGLRVNPQHSEGHTPLYDPCAPRSRLGIRRDAFENQPLDGLSGLHFHNLCEQNADAFERTLAAFEIRFGDLLPRFQWVNFGGGHHLTRPDYDVERLCRLIQNFKTRHGMQAYLEPGEAVALNAGVLVATVLDVVWNEMPIAILDASCTCHMPDVLEMPYRPRVYRGDAWDGSAVMPATADCGCDPGAKPHTFRLAGPSCLAGDMIGDYAFDAPLRPGDRLVFEDMAHYTMVKTNTFNGLNLPSIWLREPDGSIHLVRKFGYADFKTRLS